MLDSFSGDDDLGGGEDIALSGHIQSPKEGEAEYVVLDHYIGK